MDKKVYPKGIKISDNELKKVNMTTEKFHEEWNYKIKPNKNVCIYLAYFVTSAKGLGPHDFQAHRRDGGYQASLLS